ncbi:MAG: Stp1/IreP family PP2C-type Ser/Thr phosphatase [Oscillospiraceae bacterium]|nr:Stp1/IreP family PP2C-type Ser/Thr phosphatase [Oscillospiraceae bacterium]
MRAYGLTHRGAVRRENQDYLRYLREENAQLLTAVLCDGMGGAKAGAVASSIAADNFMAHAANSLDETSTPSDVRAILTEAVSYANAKVYDRALDDYSCMGMGSTLVALLVNGQKAYVANVGDSRAYLLSKNRLSQITRDHSLVEDMVARGKLTREAAQSHPKRNIITRAIGVEASVRADIFEVKFPPGTDILLCSDGLTNTVSDEEIRRTLCEQKDPEKVCSVLLNLALQNGAPDNVTVFVARQ